jgi:hypothetical protein
MNKPPSLYHGSQERLTLIEPRPARGVGAEKDRLNAVYASCLRNVAIAFSLPFVPNEKGELFFRMSLVNNEPTIILEAGSMDVSRWSYLYIVPSDTFEYLDGSQWISYAPVKPRAWEPINPKDFLHWVQGSYGR